MDEKTLIDNVLDGDQEAFAELVKQYEDKVYSLCYRMCSDREEARDLAQEAFVKAWRGLAQYKADAAFSTWLYRLTSNVCIDYLRKRKKHTLLFLQREEEQTPDIPDPAPSPEARFLEKQKQEAVRDAMGQLEEEFRIVLTLRAMEDHNYDEIARILNIKVGTVKSRISRGREKLRKILLANGNDFLFRTVKEHGEEDAL